MIRSKLLLSLFLFSGLAMADTDDADSLDFESFHSNEEVSSEEAAKKITLKTLQVFKESNIDIYTASASYNASESSDVLKAQASLYQQMDKRCADGWTKMAEWAEVKRGVRVLKNKFRCR